MSELMPFWEPPGFMPMTKEAISALCNGDATPDVKALRAQTLIIYIDDHQSERGND